MFADPPQTGLLRPEFLHHRARIRVTARETIRFERLEHPFEAFEFFLEYAVVILTPGVPGDPPVTPPLIRSHAGPVIETEGNNRTAVRQDLRGIGTAFRSASHPLHGAVVALGQPILQAVEQVGMGRTGGRRIPVRARRRNASDAYCMKPLFKGGLFEKLCGRRHAVSPSPCGRGLG